MKQATLLIGSPEQDPDLTYLTRFNSGLPIVALSTDDGSLALVEPVDLQLAVDTAATDHVLAFPVSALLSQMSSISFEQAVDYLAAVLRDHGVTQLRVAANFPYAVGVALAQFGFELNPMRRPLFGGRRLKSDAEIEAHREVASTVAECFRGLFERLARTRIADGQLLENNRPLTCEMLVADIRHFLVERGCWPSGITVSSGVAGLWPHRCGSGPLQASSPIVIDLYPRSIATLVYADMTRTMVRGRVPEMLLRMRKAVSSGRELLLQRLKPAADGSELHSALQNHFDRLGLPTDLSSDPPRGLLHASGHGVGLALHEPPFLSRATSIIECGNLLAIEPGLYEPEIGAVRTEDLVLVTDGGNELLVELDDPFEL